MAQRSPVVVGVHGSQVSAAALRVATQEARDLDLPVRTVHGWLVTDPGLPLEQAPRSKRTAAGHANATVEVDTIDPYARTGRSLLVRGLAEEVTDAHREELVQATKDSGVEPWAPGDHEHSLRIIPHSVSGRRIVRGELLPAFEDAGYV